MPREGNLEVFNTRINSGDGTTTPVYYASSDYYDLLGSADTLVVQAIIDSTIAALDVTAQLEMTQDGGREWKPVAGVNPTPSVSSPTDLPKSAMKRGSVTNGSPIPRQGRVKVWVSNGTNHFGVGVRVIACGRTA